jgi:hypothetical protein
MARPWLTINARHLISEWFDRSMSSKDVHVSQLTHALNDYQDSNHGAYVKQYNCNYRYADKHSQRSESFRS